MINREFKNIKIAMAKPFTGTLVYYDITDKNSYLEARRAFDEGDGDWFDGDYRVQLIEHDYLGWLSESILEEFLNLTEVFDDVQPQHIIYLLSKYSYYKVKEILEKAIFYVTIEANDKLEAFIKFIETYEIKMARKHLHPYIDWDYVMDDYEDDGTLVRKIETGKYLIIH